MGEGMEGKFEPLSIQEYADQALSTDRKSDGGSLSFPILGLFGEIGSLLGEVKKKQRDRASYFGYAAAVVEELGDVLWYLNIVASRGGLTLADIVVILDETNAQWRTACGTSVLFASLQPAIMLPSTEPTEAFENTLLRLAGEVGRLVTDHEAGRLI